MIDELAIDYQEWQERSKPVGISACVRVRNEAQFMGAAVRSIIDLVDEVVLLVQPSDDNTLELAHELADMYDKVNVYYYPLIPDWIDTKGFYEKNPNEPGHMVHMSNYALSKCQYSWILKVEGDVIALPTLKSILQNVRENMDKPMYYGLVILNVAGKDMNKISWENPRNGGWDEAIFVNDPSRVRFIRRSKWEVVDHNLPNHCAGWALLHMKRCKTGKDEAWNGEHYVDWNRDVVDEALRNYNQINAYPASDNPFGHHVLYTTDWKQYL